MEDNKELFDILSKEENLDAVFDIIDSKENLINHIINDEFIPKLKALAEGKGLEICGNYKRNWMAERYSGAHFRNKDWKYFDLAFQFDHEGLKGLVFGFVCKTVVNVRMFLLLFGKKFRHIIPLKTLQSKILAMDCGFIKILKEIIIGIMLKELKTC